VSARILPTSEIRYQPEQEGLIGRMNRWPHSLILVFAIFLVVLIAVVDRYTNEDISVYVFYSLPIFLAAWFAGISAGITTAGASSIAWLTVDLLDNTIPDHLLLYGNAFVRLVFFIAIALMLTALKQTLDREIALARQDFLTGLANRRNFFSSASLELERVRRYKHPFTVAFIDLDNFKSINDRLGHATGDTLLTVVGETLRTNTRVTDMTARIGGDEFVILLPETGYEAAQTVIRKLQDELCSAMKGNNWDVTFSIGMSTYEIPPESVDEMIGRPDRLMYAAKKEGPNLLKSERVE
jgi:diguanylate cyclase (GGDEF)-like protein